MQKRWIIREGDRALAFQLARKLTISPVAAQILVNRGVCDVARAQQFLNPLLKELSDPFLLNDMAQGVDRVLRAIDRKEKIVIHGDYDIDGITATVLLADFLKRMGADVDYFLPSRVDGYGVKKGSIDACREKGARLIITVDCGIGAAAEIDYAAQAGIDVVVTDHHEPEGPSPSCCAVINPKRGDSTFPHTEIAGVGVAFKFAHGILKKCRNEKLSQFPQDIDLRDYLDLVCMGTIGDVAPLVGENRIVVKFGLQKIARGDRRGIRALKNVAGLTGEIDAGHVSFRLAPRINATGRVALAHKAARLLLSDEEVESEMLALELENHNRDRQKIEAEVMKEVFAQIDGDGALAGSRIIVAAGDGWHHGVIGIVASRIVRRYNRPAVVISFDGDTGRGSARSVKNFHILDALRACQDDIHHVGGHAGAAGMAISRGSLARFRERLAAVAADRLSADDLIPAIDIDAEIALDELTGGVMKEISRLEPFGFGNPYPVFLSRRARLSRPPRAVGVGHIKLQVNGGGAEIDVIGFGLADEVNGLGVRQGDEIDIVYSPVMNTFRGEERLQLELTDVKKAKAEVKV
ncbi:MAG TPA: single-stranded-DNA-specific exonuclease RecJ [bacterium]|nr:single-stranded-DNA-specific exonuclease RecJ [bacterium]